MLQDSFAIDGKTGPGKGEVRLRQYPTCYVVVRSKKLHEPLVHKHALPECLGAQMGNSHDSAWCTIGTSAVADLSQTSIVLVTTTCMGSAQSTQSDRQDGVHPALFEYDILTMIFETFDPQDRIGRSTCARCARVCRAWNEPASRAIWSRTRWRLSDLYNVLWRYTQKADAETSRVVVYNDLAQNLRAASLRQHPTLQQSFLRCASRVRQLYVSQVTGLSKDEVRLLQRLLTWCNGTTFLPGLLSLSWIESPETDRLLPIFVPTCLEHLELIVDSTTPEKQVDDLLSKLPQAAPSLGSMVLRLFNTGFTPSSLLGNARLRRLSIFGHHSLAPDQLQAVLSLPTLESLDTRIRDFGACSDPINALSALKSLDCHGTYEDLTAFTTHLHAPTIHHLGLLVDTIDSQYSSSSQLRLSRALAAADQIPQSSLRSLHLGYRNVQSAVPQPLADARPPVSLHKDILQPLYGHLKQLDALVVDIEELVPLTEADLAQLAKAWPALRTLELAFRNGLAPPGVDVVRPSPRALVGLARACPALEQLKLEVGKAVGHIDLQTELGSDQGERGHPLRRLCLSGPWRDAPFVDALFPELDVEWGRAKAPADNHRMWDMVQRFQDARREREGAARAVEGSS